MAQSERDRLRTFELSDEDVDGMFKEMAANIRRPKLARADSEWNALGERFQGLGHRSST